METCPHGARIVITDGQPVVFVDDCEPCISLLSEYGFHGDGATEKKVTTAA